MSFLLYSAATNRQPAAERDAEAKLLEHRIKSYIGVSSDVRVVAPGRPSARRARGSG
jgi:hypothetical protein